MMPFALFALLAGLSLAAQELPAPGISPPETKTVLVTVSGIVVNSATGEPVRRALVRLSGYRERSLLTDSEGRFSFAGVPEGEVSIRALRPGFSSMRWDRPRRYRATPDMAPLKIALKPVAVIQGRAITEEKEPVAGLRMSLQISRLRSGVRTFTEVETATTGDDGSFRFSDLPKGEYYVLSGPLPNQLLSRRGRENAITGFPATSFPADPGTSPGMQVAAGQTVDVEFVLKTVPVFRVSGTMPGCGVDRIFPKFFDRFGNHVPTANNAAPGGCGFVSNLPADTYVLRVLRTMFEGAESSSGEIALAVSSDMENILVSVEPQIAIPVEAKLERTQPYTGESSGKQESSLSVRLKPGRERDDQKFVDLHLNQSGGEGIPILEGVLPGQYTVGIEPSLPWCVSSAEYGGVNVLRDGITITSAGAVGPMRITLRDDCATLNVRIQDEEASVVSIAVMPAPNSSAPKRVLPRFPVSAEGTATVYGLAPGEYSVLVFEESEAEFADDDAIQRHLTNAAHVTLTAGGKAEIIVPATKLGD